MLREAEVAAVESLSPRWRQRTRRHGRAGVTVGLTGGATLIQGVRAALGGQGALQGGRAIRVKTYWAEGRVGLD